MRDEIEVITITQKEYYDLQEDARKLRCLENAGVDNWGGYDWAMEEYYGDDE